MTCVFSINQIAQNNWRWKSIAFSRKIVRGKKKSNAVWIYLLYSRFAPLFSISDVASIIKKFGFFDICKTIKHLQTFLQIPSKASVRREHVDILVFHLTVWRARKKTVFVFLIKVNMLWVERDWTADSKCGLTKQTYSSDILPLFTWMKSLFVKPCRIHFLCCFNVSLERIWSTVLFRGREA